jgi:hypothetical protein
VQKCCPTAFALLDASAAGSGGRPFVLTAQVIVFLTQAPQLALTDSLLVDEAQDLRIAARC